MQQRCCRCRAHGWALFFYALVAILFNWPLPLKLSTHLTGPITGDTGVYVWNVWLFRHELVAHGHFPLFTNEILSLTPPIDLSLHNYTIFANVLAFPLIPSLGVVAAFNVVYLALLVFTAWAMFLLATSVAGRTVEAWLAGLLFAFSPVLVARSTAHFSLVAAAPLPIFLTVLRRTPSGGRRWPVAAGLVVAWASMCDAYYGLFCVLIAICYFAALHVRVRADGWPWRPATRYLRVLDVLLAATLITVVGIAASGGREVHVLGRVVAMRSLYTPVLALMILVIARVCLRRRPVLVVRLAPRRALCRSLLLAGTACAALLSPVLFALMYNLADGGSFHGPVFWRSSPPGIDLLALFMPNPNHRWFGGPWRAWLTLAPNAFIENVASFTLVGIAVVAVAVWRCRFQPPRVWLAMTVFFAAVALGPFVHVGGVNTYVPGPWAFLRYVPVLSATRTPARYAIPLMMAFSGVFALALRSITARYAARRRAILVAVAGALIFELAPIPKQLYSARVPSVYRTIAADPRDVRVLELPFGIRDGEWSEGNFTAATQFYQTVHEKPLVGGYLSRISQRELDRQRQSVTVRHLLRLSAGRRLDPAELEDVRNRADAFLNRTRLGYVVIDARRTPPALRQFAIDTYHLVKLGEDDGHELFAPAMGRARKAQQ